MTSTIDYEKMTRKIMVMLTEYEREMIEGILSQDVVWRKLPKDSVIRRVYEGLRRKITTRRTCGICYIEFLTIDGNNADSVVPNGRYCDYCDRRVVCMARTR